MNKELIGNNQKMEIIYSNFNNKKITIKKKLRNYGIDLVRIISMFFIVSIHIIFQGGPLFHTKILSLEHKLHLFLKIIYGCGVNIFGMISGYIGYSHKYSNLFYHLITTFFYNFLIVLLFKYFSPKLINNYIIYLFPVYNNNYWYFNEYFKMFFFINLINKGSISMEVKSMKNFIFILFFVISCFGIIKNFEQRLFTDSFELKNGISYNWLIILYCYGSYLRKSQITIKKNYLFYLKYISIIFFVALIKLMINVNTFNNERIGRIFDDINNTSPTEVILAISFIKLFSNINIKNKIIIKFISIFGPLTFGVYLIHGHKLIMNNFISNNFLWILKYKNFFIILLLEILCALGIFLVCSIIDLIREQLFIILKLKKLCILTENFIKKISEKISICDII